MTIPKHFPKRIPSLHLFSSDETGHGPFADIEFISEHHGLAAQRLLSNAASSNGNVIPGCTAFDMNTLKDRIVQLNHQKGRHAVMFNSPYQASSAPELILEFAWERSKFGEERILIVDCNFRTPVLNRVYQLSRGVGVTEYVTGTHAMHEIIMRTNLNNVYLARTGYLRLDPVQLLMSQRLIRLFQVASRQFDFVLINTPPYRDYVDAFILAKFVQPTVLLVMDSRYSSWAQTQDIRDELRVFDVNVLGVMNNRD